MDRPPSALRTPLAGLLAGLAALGAVSLFNHPLVPSMEPRFAEAVREMAASGRWLIPVKNGVPYIEYPPLYFWAGLLLRSLGLPLAAAVRLPAVLSLLGWVALLDRMQRRHLPELPPLALALAGAGLPIALANFFLAQTDGPLAFAVLLALLAHLDRRAGLASDGFPWRFWGGTALAVAAKGPVGLVLVALPAGADLALAALAPPGPARLGRFAEAILRLRPARGLALVLLANGPWYVAAGRTAGWDFCRAALIYQNFTRFTVGFDHLQPVWYYLVRFWSGFFPAALLLPVALWRARRAPAGPPAARLGALWFLAALLFFTAAKAKQEKYLLPAAPGLLLWVFGALSAFPPGTARRAAAALRAAGAALLALFAAGLLFVLPRYAARIGDRGAFAAAHAAIVRAPGTLYAFRWPRAAMLLEFGAPLPHFRGPREVFAAARLGRLRAGDYLLVEKRRLRAAGAPAQPDDARLPALEEWFETVELGGPAGFVLLRVRPGAAGRPLPPLPAAPPAQWWEKFDTD